MGGHDRDNRPPDYGLVAARWLDEGLCAYAGIVVATLLAFLGASLRVCLFALACAFVADLIALLRRDD